MKRITNTSIFLFFLLMCSGLSGASVTLSADSDTVQVDGSFRLILSAEGSFESIVEPDFNGFEVENRSESQSNSISIINGKMESKKSINYTYFLRAVKNGVFKIGPAKAVLKNGKTESSNTVTVTVTGSGSGMNPGKGSSQDDVSSGDQSAEGSPVPGSLISPLTKWERKTPSYFIRAVVDPQGDIYEGEPVTVRYYLFVKPGAISDLSMYKSPAFENCWKEERQESRLSFNRVAIEGEVYDYALLKTFAIIPEKGVQNISGTQMIVDVMTGSFFNVKKMSISSPALMIPLKPLPDAQMHQNGIFGDFTVEVDRDSVTIDRNNMLETVEFRVKGCGNFQSAELKPADNRALKIFSPEVDNRISQFSKGYCGEKRYKFMLKGISKGSTVLKMEPFEAFSRENGWVTVKTPEVTVEVNDVTVSGGDSDKDGRLANYELLKELPAGMKIYSTKSIVERLWFRIALAVPFVISLISFLIWLTGLMMKRRSRSFNVKLDRWDNALNSAKGPAELLNTFYDALKDLYGIEIRGERNQDLLKKHGNSFADITALIREIEYLTFSGGAVENMAKIREKASQTLRFRGRKK